MTRGVTAKARLYFGLGAAALLAALILGRIEFAALAIPPLVAVAVGFAPTRRDEIRAQMFVEPERLFEGDTFSLILKLRSAARVDEAEVALSIPEGVQVVESSAHLHLSLPPNTEIERRIELRATRWGGFHFGRFAIRTFGPGRLVAFEQGWALPVVARVYPALEHLRTSIDPVVTQVYAGNYVSRRAGDGIEFAGLREFGTGDRMRRINWRVSSRSRELIVNDFYLERNADVVLFVDSYSDSGASGEGSLASSVRAAASLAGRYLADKNRVGLFTFGGSVRWLTPAMGRVHFYRVLDYLLDVEVSKSFVWRDIDSLPYGSLPSQAQVVVFSPLIDRRTVVAALDLRARGFSIVVVDTLDETAVLPERSPEGETAYRMWKLERAATRFDFERAGVAVAAWNGRDPLQLPLASIAATRRVTAGR